MRKLLLALLISCAPAAAEIRIADIRVAGPNVTVRVENTNPFEVRVDQVKLRLRQSNRWVVLKDWAQPLALRAGESRELSTVVPGLPGNYELQAEVAASALGPEWEAADR